MRAARVIPGMGPPRPMSWGSASRPSYYTRTASYQSLLCSAAHVISHGQCTPWWVLRSASPEVHRCNISTQLLGRDLYVSLQCLHLPWKEARSYHMLRLDTVKQQMFTAVQNICISKLPVVRTDEGQHYGFFLGQLHIAFAFVPPCFAPCCRAGKLLLCPHVGLEREGKGVPASLACGP